tara:strand:- start:762 stop:1136 length:375 start_codon:yes stop_codon:yes gene_type:complete
MKISKQFLRFTFIGFQSTLINYLFYIFIFKLSSNLLLASLIGYISGIFNSFIFGKKWVFRSLETINSTVIIKFATVYLIGCLMMTLIINLLSKWGFEYRLAWSLGITYSILNNFLGSKYFVFKK